MELLKDYYIVNTVSNICGGLVPALKMLGIVYMGIKVLVPIILIVISMIELVKAITTKDKSDNTVISIIKKVVAAIMIFTILTLVKTVVMFIDPNAENSCTSYIFNTPDIINPLSPSKPNEILATSIKLSNETSSIKAGSSCGAKIIHPKDIINLVATITPNKVSDKKVVWKSSNTKVATVNNKGKVSVKSTGTAKITATVDNISVSCNIKSLKPEYLKSELIIKIMHSNGMDYHLYIGEKIEKREKPPIILALHGGAGRCSRVVVDDNTRHSWCETTECGQYPPQTYLYATIKREKKTYEGAIIVFPTKSYCDWPGKEADRAFEILQSVVKEYNGDPDRIYIVGSSQGGAGTLYLLQKHKNYFAYASVFSPAGTGNYTDAIFRTPMWFFVSDNEYPNIQDYVIRLTEAFTKKKYVHKVTIMHVGHDTSNNVFPNSDYYNFILKQKRGQKVVFDPNIEKSLKSKGLLGTKLSRKK